MPAGHCGTLICPTIYWPAFLYVLLFGASSIIHLRATSPPCCDSILLSIGLARLSVNNFAALLVAACIRPYLSLHPGATCRSFLLPCGWFPLLTVFTKLSDFTISARYFRSIRPATDLKILYIFLCCGFIIHRLHGFVNSFFEIFWKISARYYKALRTRLFCREFGQIISRRQNSAWLSGGFYVQ